MLIDITLPVTPEMMGTAWENTVRKAVVFDVSHIRGRDIEITDIDFELVRADMFVAFRTGYIEDVTYGTPQYFKEHPQLSDALIDALLVRKISIIGVDCAGIRRGEAHVPADQRCADQGVFVIENLWDLKSVLSGNVFFTARTYPMRFLGITGLPCRVIAEF